MALWDALAATPKPAVLVFQDVSPTATHSVHLGDVMATIGVRLGAVGLVTDGAVRDLEGIRPLRFHSSRSAWRRPTARSTSWTWASR